jgi:hypothetical protein
VRRLLTLIPVVALGCMIASAGAGATDAAGQEPTRGTSDQQARAMKLRVDIEGTTITATLLDTETSRDFVSLLPLTLTLEDYAATEKISYLSRRLSTEGAPPGSDPSVGDIAYYSPWGNLAVFYRDAVYAGGLIKLGTIDSGVDALSRPGPLRVTIELVEK